MHSQNPEGDQEMKLRSSIATIIAGGALLLPSIATAADVHITIGLNHVTRDGNRKLKVSGELHNVGGGAVCTDNRHVVIQRRKNSNSDWNSLGHDMTSSGGAYKKVVGDKTGQYRVVAPKTGSCEKDTSDVKSHGH
jgi:hypothetical protein